MNGSRLGWVWSLLASSLILLGGCGGGGGKGGSDSGDLPLPGSGEGGEAARRKGQRQLAEDENLGN